LGIAFIVGGLVYLVISLHFGRRASAIKHLVMDKCRISFFRGSSRLFETRWNEVDGLRYTPGTIRYNPAAIHLTIKGQRFSLTGDMDLPLWKVHDIFIIMERAWNEAKVIEVESV
jgi:hypothetical protein